MLFNGVTMFKKSLWIILLMVSFVFVLAGCIGPAQTGCTIDKQCPAWQSCNLSSKTCAVAPGYCVSSNECNTSLMECDTNTTHTCVYKRDRCVTDANCDMWQACASDQYCRPAPGYCSDNTQCDQTFEYCKPANHICSPKPGFCTADFDCDAWKRCDTMSRKCFLIGGRCDFSTDCSSWQDCEVKSHTCIAKAGFCINDDDCSEWARCDPQSKRCIARQGYCDADNQCNNWEYCSSNTHLCTVKKDFCGIDADCGSWQICTLTHTCQAKSGYCSVDKDCVMGEVCNEQNHLCQ